MMTDDVWLPSDDLPKRSDNFLGGIFLFFCRDLRLEGRCKHTPWQRLSFI